MTEDGHSPRTCNWRECNAESDVPCPFKADDTSKAKATATSIAYTQTTRCRYNLLGYSYGEPLFGSHKYTLPVEWETRSNARKVTKLRCECGEETVRA